MTASQFELTPPRKTTVQYIDEILTAYAKAADKPDADRALELLRVAERETALQALTYVLCRNFAAAEDSAKEGVFSLSFKVTFDRNETPTAIKAVSSCSLIKKADIELTCPVEEEG
jgi:hypothetical protein